MEAGAMRIEMKNIRCGDLFWECEGPHQQVQMEAMADATVNGNEVSLQARDVGTGEPQAYFMRLDVPWYGPSLYNEPAYSFPHKRVEAA